MSEGLTRRRGAGASGSPSLASSATFDTPSSSRPDSRAAKGDGAIEGRSKVAYDPRDMNDDTEAKAVPKLTLMEEVLLLGLKDKAVSYFE